MDCRATRHEALVAPGIKSGDSGDWRSQQPLDQARRWRDRVPREREWGDQLDCRQAREPRQASSCDAGGQVTALLRAAAFLAVLVRRRPRHVHVHVVMAGGDSCRRGLPRLARSTRGHRDRRQQQRYDQQQVQANAGGGTHGASVGQSRSAGTPAIRILRPPPEHRRARIAPRCSNKCSHETELPADLSELRTAQHRHHAGGRVPVFSRLPGMRRSAEPEAGRLLRVLFIRIDSVSADPAGPGLLRRLGSEALNPGPRERGIDVVPGESEAG